MTTEKTENNKTTDEKTEKIELFINNMTAGADSVTTVYRNMLVGAEEALAVIEDPQVQEAVATIVSRCILAYERIKEKTDKNIDELLTRRSEIYQDSATEEE